MIGRARLAAAGLEPGDVLEPCKQSGVLAAVAPFGRSLACPLCGRACRIGAAHRWPTHYRPRRRRG